jgi:dUTP pyrophosphatase
MVIVSYAKVHSDAILPSYATDGSAGLDLHAIEEGVLAPGGRARVKTGIAIQLPRGYEAQVRPRSGLSYVHGVAAVVGTVDSDYRGEVCVVLVNSSRDTYHYSRADRIAQLVVSPVARATLVQGDLEETTRGTGGFGSTGR